MTEKRKSPQNGGYLEINGTNEAYPFFLLGTHQLTKCLFFTLTEYFFLHFQIDQLVVLSLLVLPIGYFGAEALFLPRAVRRFMDVMKCGCTCKYETVRVNLTLLNRCQYNLG